MNSGYNNYFNSFDIFGLLGIGQNALAQVNKIGNLAFTYEEWAFLSHVDQELSTLASPSFVDLTLTGALIADTINEYTLNNGVMIDNVWLKDYMIYATNIEHMNMTGYHSCSGPSPTYWTIAGDQFTLDKTAIGYIRSVPVTCASGQTVTLTINDTNIIYFDLTGILQITNTVDRALYQDNVVLGKVFYDGSATFFVKECHPYDFQSSVSNFLHETVGSVVQDGGGNLTYKSATECKIVGDAYINDHGLVTEMKEADADPITFKFMFLDAAGEWEMKSETSTIPFYYNPAGTPIALTTSAKWGVYRVYAMLDSLNVSTPTFIAIINNAEYNNSTAATNAIGSGAVQAATKYLADMEPVSLGYILFKNAGVQSVVVQKATINERYTGSATSSHLLLNDLDGSPYLTGGHSYLVQRHEAAVDPTVNDDEHSYHLGAIWINTVLNKQWICIDNTVGNAVWKLFVISAPNQYMDHIDELTAGHGVVIESVEFKDGIIGSNLSNILIGNDVGGDFITTAGYNTCIGNRTCEKITTGSSNISIGAASCFKLTTGGYNIALGVFALYSALDGNYNTCLGYRSGYSILNADYNVCIGLECGYGLTSGNANLLLGYKAGNGITSGIWNVCLGVDVGQSITTGGYNVVIGQTANVLNASNCISMGNQAKCGSNEHAIAIGTQATAYNSYGIMIGYSTGNISAGTSNIGIGAYALNSLNTGTYNIAIGSSAGNKITSSSNNICIGTSAGTAITTSPYNVCIGYQSALYLAGGGYNTIIGYRNIPTATGTGNNVSIGVINDCLAVDTESAITIGRANKAASYGVAIGNDNSAFFLNNSVAIGRGNLAGEQSVMLGYYNAPSTNTGKYNVGIGYRVMQGLTSGYGNVAIGGYFDGAQHTALNRITTGYFNVGIGYESGDTITTGYGNTCIGFQSKVGAGVAASTAIGYITQSEATYGIVIGAGIRTGGDSIMIGHNCGRVENTGNYNIGMGWSALLSASSSGYCNIALGGELGTTGPLYRLTTGSYNIAMGSYASANITSGTHTIALGYAALYLGTGNHNIGIGYAAGYSISSGYENVCIGYNAGDTITTGYQNTMIGAMADTGAGSLSACTCIGYGARATGSSQFILGGSYVSYLECQVGLTIVSDERKKSEIKPLKQGLKFINQLQPKQFILNDDESKKIRHGLIAQDVLKIDESYVDTTNPDRYGLTYEEFIAPLINAVKTLSKMNKSLQKRVYELEKKLYTSIIYNDQQL